MKQNTMQNYVHEEHHHILRYMFRLDICEHGGGLVINTVKQLQCCQSFPNAKMLQHVLACAINKLTLTNTVQKQHSWFQNILMVPQTILAYTWGHTVEHSVYLSSICLCKMANA